MTTIPPPSNIRVVRLYSGAQMLASRGITPQAPYSWVSKHPLTVDWWWLDATGWLTDPTGTAWDTIGQISAPIVITDPALTISQTAISTDGMQAGILFGGGTPGGFPVVRVVLTSATTALQEALDVVLPIQNLVAA